MDNDLLDAILTFNVVVDAKGRVCHLGPTLARLVPDTVGRPLHTAVHHLVDGPDLETAPGSSWAGRILQLRFRERAMTLRGEFLDRKDGTWLFAGTLDPSDTHRIAELELRPDDFAASDLTLDFSVLKWTRDTQARETGMAMLKLRKSLAQRDVLRERVETDALTGAANRAHFLDLLDLALVEANQAGRPVAVLVVDIDRFKSMNDLYGHVVGDEALVSVANHLQWVVASHGTVGRIGGDQFGVLIDSDQVTPDRFELIVEQLCTDIATVNDEPVALGGRSIPVSVTIGLAFDRGDAESNAVLRHADVAMSAARRAGAGPIGIFDPATQLELELRRSLADELAEAIKQGDIELLFQPIVDLASRHVVKYEVLSRWRHPSHGPVPPSLFFEIAEHCQLIQPLDHYVIRTALEAARDQLSLRNDIPSLSLNVSALSLTDDLPSFLRDVLDEMHYPANRLCIEVTETSSIKDMRRTSRVLHELDALGIVVSLDDFGTGYSSLTYLHQLPIGALKIDRSFVADMASSRKAYQLVCSILGVAKRLHLPVVAEGIETIEQCILLENLGCQQGQGYFFAHPAPAQVVALARGHALPFPRDEVDPTRPDQRGQDPSTTLVHTL